MRRSTLGCRSQTSIELSPILKLEIENFGVWNWQPWSQVSALTWQARWQHSAHLHPGINLTHRVSLSHFLATSNELLRIPAYCRGMTFHRIDT